MKHTILHPFRVLCLLLLAGLTAACNSGKHKCVLEGEIDGLGEADLYIYNESGSISGVDTVHVKDGKFTYECQIAEPAIAHLLYPNFSETLLIMAPGDKLSFTVKAARLATAKVKGSEENELLSKFRRSILEKSDAESRKLAAQFVRKNLQTLAAQAVFVRYFVQAERRDVSLTLSLLDLLKAAQPHNKNLKSLDLYLRQQLQASTGQPLPDFKACSLRGDTISRASLLGKPAVIAFLSSWSVNSNNQLRHIQRMASEMKGRAQFVIVSLDEDREQFKDRFFNDTAAYQMVCPGGAFQSPIAQRLGVRYVPGNILVNAKGRIVGRDLELPALESELKKL